MTQVSPFLTPGEVAELYGTTAETVRRWAKEGLIPSVVMPSGRRKYRRDEIESALADAGIPSEAASA